MKYIIIVLLFCISNTAIALDNIPVEYLTFKEGDILSEQLVEEMISKYATGTKAYMMKRTIECESGYKNIQSNIVKNGEREVSYGISQINIYWNNVTKEQSLDPEFSVKFMSDNWETVKWYGYLRNEDKCNII